MNTNNLAITRNNTDNTVQLHCKSSSLIMSIIAGMFLLQMIVFVSKSTSAVASSIIFFTGNETGTTISSSNGAQYSLLNESQNGNNILQMQFDDHFYPGVYISLQAGKTVNLISSKQKGSLHFKIKGAMGQERCYISLLDNGTIGKNRVEVKIKNTDFFNITDKWQQIDIPLSAFTDNGARWYEKDSSLEYATIDWGTISSIEFSTAKDDNYGRSVNRIATVFISDLRIDTLTEYKLLPRLHTPWQWANDTTTDPSVSTPKDILTTWFDSTIEPHTFVYTYGDPTDFKVIKSKDSARAVFATYMNDHEWSGVTLFRNRYHSVDVKPYYETGGIEFCVKGAHGGELFLVGLLDDESDGVDRKVQTRFHSRKFVKVTKEWQTVQIPFAAFEPSGRWWNSDTHHELLGTVDWSKISEIRFCVNKYENQGAIASDTSPVAIYFSSIHFLKKVNTIANEVYWKSFHSDSPDMQVESFNNGDILKNWNVTTDSKSTIEPQITNNTLDNSHAVALKYNILNWGSASMTLPQPDTVRRNWSHHNTLSFDFYSSEKSQTCMVMILDAHDEAWNAHFETVQGWQTIDLPFSRFRQFDWWQPDDAVADGKMDLEAVRSIDFRPGVTGRSGIIAVDNIQVKNSSNIVKSNARAISVNQIGYFNDFPKQFSVISDIAQNFIIQNSNQDVVYRGVLSKSTFWPASDENIKTGDFSGISQPGNYLITIEETGDTCSVSIKSDREAYSPIIRDIIRTYYFQRASLELPEKYAGQFKRMAGHLDTACILHQSTGKSGVKNVTGGWYDAGDYGKYIVNGGITCATLMSAYALNPDQFGDSLNIPESGNGIPDILDEIRYELEWFKRMQDDDGGVFFKVGTLKWDGFISPVNAVEPRYIIGKSTASALNFAAAMAQAARVYKKFDKDFSKDCLKRAFSAWDWAVTHPSITEPSETGGTGAYGDNQFDDEFFWAACELFTTTKKSSFKKSVEHYGDITAMKGAANWFNTENLGWFTLATNFPDNAFGKVKQSSIYIRTLADNFIKAADSIPYRIPTTEFIWGSNDVMLNHAVVLCYAYKLTGIRKHLTSANEILNYICGNNAVGYSFITGHGFKSPQQPHHRILGSDGIDEPLPGFIVGGPNADRQDEQSSEPGVFYPLKEPARSYVDIMAAYASNETCINWSAALLFVLSFVRSAQ